MNSHLLRRGGGVAAALLLSLGASAQVTAAFTTYGQGCAGTGTGLGATTLAPAVANTSWGSGNAIPCGWTPNRYQQAFLGADLPQPITIAGLSLRQPHTGPVAHGFTVDLDVRVGYTSRYGASLSTAFDTNWDLGLPVVVVPRQQVVFPDQLATYPQSLTQFVLTIPWAVPFAWTPQPGRNLLVEINVYGNSWGSQIYGYPLDNVSGTTSLWGTPAGTALANGGPVRGFGLAMGFVAQTQAAVPRLFSLQTPQIGDQFRVRLDQCRSQSVVLLLAGLSNTWWGGQPLPLGLAPYGAPGCSALLDPIATDLLVADAAGTTNRQYDLPNSIYLLGLHLYHQGFVVDPPANPLGLAASNGGDGTLGNQ